VRIDGKDADAIGKRVAETASAAPAEPLTPDQLKDRVWTALRGVYDPEIPVNVVDLGLVYRCDVQAQPGGQYGIQVDMTLTAPGCGMGNVLKEDAERRIRQIPGVQAATVNIVVEPAWHQGLMSEAARLELGL
jgi:probable FeS assembly SUF system protein SufT